MKFVNIVDVMLGSHPQFQVSACVSCGRNDESSEGTLSTSPGAELRLP